jgi:cell division transport system permease protein
MQSFLRVLKSGFSSFFRNGWLSVASITVMILTLMTLSTFFVINVALGTGVKAIQDKIDMSVYLKDNAKQANVIDLQEALAGLSEVKSVKYISKDEAMARFKQQNSNNKALLDSLNQVGNSLPASLEIKVNNPDKLDAINSVLTQDKYKPSIDKVSYADNKDIIQRLLRATNFTKELGIGITIVFTIVSLVIIFNTIRIAIFARMEEIEIMKLVGATPNFIKGPFLIEGAIYGLVATIFSMLIMTAVMYFAAPAVIKYFSDAGASLTDFIEHNLLIIALAQLLFGLAIGIFSSWLAIRKHLKLSTT